MILLVHNVVEETCKWTKTLGDMGVTTVLKRYTFLCKFEKMNITCTSRFAACLISIRSKCDASLQQLITTEPPIEPILAGQSPVMPSRQGLAERINYREQMISLSCR